MEDNKNNNSELPEVEQPSNEQGKSTLFAVITGIIMVTIYLGMAFLLVFTTLFVGKVPEWVRYMMGVVFFLYGIYRGYRVYVSRK
ncbi:MAG: hypothetical protein IJE18_03820 [Bacteroidaceae bacterium]|nr:hypothetical protein [Bacteroidales bacterium]MBP3671889.1 hypothetical protein [Bacteroidaceae bacterium]MBQ2979222.1 hypothetical protein [Bacteroidaceae bacterium]